MPRQRRDGYAAKPLAGRRMDTDTTMRAGIELTRLLVRSYKSERGVHAETAIGATAALAGDFALRAVERNPPASGFVTSEKVSALLFGTDPLGTTGLCGVIRQGAVKAGAAETAIPELEDITARIKEAIEGGGLYPPLSVPEEHYPQEWSPNACPRLRAAAAEICQSHGLNGPKSATALVIACAFLINETREVLPPEIGARIALETMIGVARMAPVTEEQPDRRAG